MIKMVNNAAKFANCEDSFTELPSWPSMSDTFCTRTSFRSSSTSAKKDSS